MTETGVLPLYLTSGIDFATIRELTASAHLLRFEVKSLVGRTTEGRAERFLTGFEKASDKAWLQTITYQMSGLPVTYLIQWFRLASSAVEKQTIIYH